MVPTLQIEIEFPNFKKKEFVLQRPLFKSERFFEKLRNAKENWELAMEKKTYLRPFLSDELYDEVVNYFGVNCFSLEGTFLEFSYPTRSSFVILHNGKKHLFVGDYLIERIENLFKKEGRRERIIYLSKILDVEENPCIENIFIKIKNKIVSSRKFFSTQPIQTKTQVDIFFGDTLVNPSSRAI